MQPACISIVLFCFAYSLFDSSLMFNTCEEVELQPLAAWSDIITFLMQHDITPPSQRVEVHARCIQQHKSKSWARSFLVFFKGSWSVVFSCANPLNAKDKFKDLWKSRVRKIWQPNGDKRNRVWELLRIDVKKVSDRNFWVEEASRILLIVYSATLNSRCSSDVNQPIYGWWSSLKAKKDSNFWNAVNR